MASLKEIKGRIGSVEGTLKITSAMKMVASAKLHKAQIAIEGMLPYDRQLHKIMVSLLADGTTTSSPLCHAHAAVRRVAVVAIASNSSLCGGYNGHVIRLTSSVLAEYARQGLAEGDIDCYVIGRKLDQSLGKLPGFSRVRDYVDQGDHPAFATAQALADRLIADYLAGRIDRVELVYMHFKSTATQIPTREVYLPVPLESAAQPAQAGASTSAAAGLSGAATASRSASFAGYIVEPSPAEVLGQLIPDALRMKVFTVMLDAQAAEHAARTVAMQTATDNANDLLGELRIQYNKGRQAAITAELLDIVGGSMQ